VLVSETKKLLGKKIKTCPVFRVQIIGIQDNMGSAIEDIDDYADEGEGQDCEGINRKWLEQ
jgi:hypothetical protein